MTFSLRAFVDESNRIEGIPRTSVADIRAHLDFLEYTSISVGDLENFVSTIQPGAILRRKPGLNVQVGNHMPPTGGPLIEVRLAALLEDTDKVTVYQTHLDYETLHPFTDGNGRSGRALWLWMMGGQAPLGFLHQFYYQTLSAIR